MFLSIIMARLLRRRRARVARRKNGVRKVYRRSKRMRRTSNRRTRGNKRTMPQNLGRRVRPRLTTSLSREAAGPGNELVRRYNRVNRPWISVRRLALGAYQPRIDHFQGISNFDTNSGYEYFVNKGGLINDPILLPMKWLEITNWGNRSAATAFHSLGWSAADSAANVTSDVIQGQQQGGVATQPTWEVIQGPLNGVVDANKAYIKYLKCEFNFYGARKRFTRFQVHHVKMNDNESDPVRNGSNIGARQFISAMEKDLIYSNMGLTNNEWKKRVKILNTWTYNVQPMTSTDLNTTTGKIMNAKIFLSINKLFTMRDPASIQLPSHLHGAQYFNDSDGSRDTVHPKAREFLLITAFAPDRLGPEEQPSPEESPSFDFMFTRKMLVASGGPVE